VFANGQTVGEPPALPGSASGTRNAFGGRIRDAHCGRARLPPSRCVARGSSSAGALPSRRTQPKNTPETRFIHLPWERFQPAANEVAMPPAAGKMSAPPGSIHYRNCERFARSHALRGNARCDALRRRHGSTGRSVHPVIAPNLNPLEKHSSPCALCLRGKSFGEKCRLRTGRGTLAGQRLGQSCPFGALHRTHNEQTGKKRAASSPFGSTHERAAISAERWLLPAAASTGSTGPARRSTATRRENPATAPPAPAE
jgi:hypothetical protein